MSPPSRRNAEVTAGGISAGVTAADGIVRFSWRNLADDSMFTSLAREEEQSQFGAAFKVKTHELFPQHFD